jgi:hypothetical protein
MTTSLPRSTAAWPLSWQMKSRSWHCAGWPHCHCLRATYQEVASLLQFDLCLGEPAQRRVAHGNGFWERPVYLSPQAECASRIIGGF